MAPLIIVRRPGRAQRAALEALQQRQRQEEIAGLRSAIKLLFYAVCGLAAALSFTISRQIADHEARFHPEQAKEKTAGAGS